MSDTRRSTSNKSSTSSTKKSSYNAYYQRQVGLLGILLIISGIAQLARLATSDWGVIGIAIFEVLWGLGFLWIEVEDKGESLLVTTGPCRWTWCGWGKEKVKYSEIRDYDIAKTCMLTMPGSFCTGVMDTYFMCRCILVNMHIVPGTLWERFWTVTD